MRSVVTVSCEGSTNGRTFCGLGSACFGDIVHNCIKKSTLELQVAVCVEVCVGDNGV